MCNNFYTQTDRQAGRCKDKQTGRQIDRQTGASTDIYIETDRKIERCTDNSMHVQVLTYGINICTRAVIFGHIASQRLIHIRTTQHKQISLKNVRRKCCTRSVDFNQKYKNMFLGVSQDKS